MIAMNNGDAPALGLVIEQLSHNPNFLDDYILRHVQTPQAALVALDLLDKLIHHKNSDDLTDPHLQFLALQYIPTLMDRFFYAGHIAEKSFDLIESAAHPGNHPNTQISAANLVRQIRPKIDNYVRDCATTDRERALTLLTRMNRLTLAGQRSSLEKVRIIYRAVASDRKYGGATTLKCEAVAEPRISSRPNLTLWAQFRNAMVRKKAGL